MSDHPSLVPMSGLRHVATLPCDRILHLCVADERVWALVKNNRKWWQFWRPETAWIDASPFLYIEAAA